MSRTRLMVLAAVMIVCGAALWADPVTVRYTLWDANQLPAYQKVADAFMAKNPGIRIEISQMGWADYWNDLQTSMVAGTASDVFTDHLAKYPEFAAKGQLLDIEPMVKADKVSTASTSPAWLTCGRVMGNASAFPRIGTPLRLSTTRTWPGPRASPKRK